MCESAFSNRRAAETPTCVAKLPHRPYEYPYLSPPPCATSPLNLCYYSHAQNATSTAAVLRLYVLILLSLRIASTKASSMLIVLNLHELVPIVPQEYGASVHWDSFRISASCIKISDQQCRIFGSTMAAVTDRNVHSDHLVLTGSNDRNILNYTVGKGNAKSRGRCKCEA